MENNKKCKELGMGAGELPLFGVRRCSSKFNRSTVVTRRLNQIFFKKKKKERTLIMELTIIVS